MPSTQDVTGLSDGQLRDRLSHVSRSKSAWQQEEKLLLAERLVRSIERQLPPPAPGQSAISAVHFQTCQYLNGFFFDEFPCVYLTAESAPLLPATFRERYACPEVTVEMDLMHSAVGDEYWPLQPVDKLVVSLRTRTVEIQRGV